MQAMVSKDKPAFIQISLLIPLLLCSVSTVEPIPYQEHRFFVGQCEVKNGLFEQSLHLPRNVIFKKPGAKGDSLFLAGFRQWFRV